MEQLEALLRTIRQRVNEELATAEAASAAKLERIRALCEAVASKTPPGSVTDTIYPSQILAIIDERA